MSNDLPHRVEQHRAKTTPGFTSRYRIDQLVYFETTGDVLSAIRREKEIKGWVRVRKMALIESVNPGWADLSEQWRMNELDSSLRSE